MDLAWAKSLALAGEERHGERRERAAELVALAEGDDPAAAAWALIALAPVARPSEWHARREQIDRGLPPELVARVALAAGLLANRGGEALAGVAEAERAARIADEIGDADLGAWARVQLAVFADWRRDRAASQAHLDVAAEILGGRRTRVRCLLLHRRAYLAVCDQRHEVAEAACLEAIEVARSLELPGFVASALFVRALVAVDRGDSARALALLAESEQLDLPDPDGIRSAERDALRARLALVGGDFDEAEATFARLIPWAIERGWGRKAAAFQAERSIARSVRGAVEGAAADLVQARAALSGTTSEIWVRAAELFARAGEHGWRPEDTETLLGFEAATPASRLLRRWMLGRVEGPGRILAVESHAVELDGARVDLGRAPVPRRLLARLVRARVDGERGVPVDALADAVWPGEKMLVESRQERVYATVHRLRRLGLGDLVESGPDGYRLRPDVELMLRAGLSSS